MKILSYFFVACILLASCRGGKNDDEQFILVDGTDPEEEVEGINDLVSAAMEGVYLWSEYTPEDVNPSLYDNPSDLLSDLKYRPLDRWSYIRELPTANARLSTVEEVGLGVILGALPNGQIFVIHTLKGSPAWEAGIRRGDRLVSINGQAATVNNGGVLYTRTLGESFTLTVQALEEEEKTIEVSTATLDIDYVSEVRVLNISERKKAGYLLYDSFRSRSINALNKAFEYFQQEGISYLILDLRYNGGGEVRVAQHLASLIYGQAKDADVFITETYNERFKENNKSIKFTSQSNSVMLEHIVVITGVETASASEAIIHGLRPYLPVKTIGDTTHGKNVGGVVYREFGYEFVPITFYVKNSQGNGDYAEGIPADYNMPDYLSIPLGEERGRVGAALDYLKTGIFPLARKADQEQVRPLAQPFTILVDTIAN
ncbi:S41 family peptidase [Algivirga pacifica]|uniref:PDZ domain-containing protein n=1 Tax=Algivirga pacifica TaxID=1162670 RepID=A0ABP9DHH0_9BACT